MAGNNRPLVTGEPVEFEKYKPVEVQDFGKITHHYRGTYRTLYVQQINKQKPKEVNM